MKMRVCQFSTVWNANESVYVSLCEHMFFLSEIFGMHMYVCIYVYVCWCSRFFGVYFVCVHIHVQIYIYTYIPRQSPPTQWVPLRFICTHIHTYKHTYAYKPRISPPAQRLLLMTLRTHTCTDLYIHTYIRIHTSTIASHSFAYTYKHTNIQTYIHMHTSTIASHSVPSFDDFAAKLLLHSVISSSSKAVCMYVCMYV